MIGNFIIKLLAFIGSLCILLYGMEMLSNGIQKGAGSNLQKLLGKITGNRFLSVLTGLTVTAIIQSSGATTVMVVSFVNAEILSLTSAIGIIFGANIGTTVTAWIVSFFGFSFNIANFSIPLFGLGFLLKLFKKCKLHNFADCFMGFALLFLGLGYLKETLSLNAQSVSFLQNISDFGVFGLLIGVFIGAFITALIHSSSAMTAIVLTMTANNSLSWEFAAAIILGSNIGSTIDAVMSSFGASVNAKRTALIHVAFNVSNSIIALLFFKPFLSLIDFIVPGTPQTNSTNHIAMLHTIFNVIGTLIYLPFVNQISDAAKRFIKDSPEEENEHYKLPTILPSTRANADIYSFQILNEISKMSQKIMDMFDSVCNVFNHKKNNELEDSIEKVTKIENFVDEMNESITRFLQHCSRLPNANKKEREHFSRLIQITDSLENLSDECCSLMHSVKKYVSSKDYSKKSNETKKIEDYFERVHIFYEQVCQFILLGISPEQKILSEEVENKIDSIKKQLKKDSKRRIEQGYDVKTELQYMDIARKLEKAGDCIYSIVQNL